MIILQIITRSDLGGAQSVVLNLANVLSATHKVIVVAGVGDGKMWQMLSSNIIKEHVPSLQRELSLLKEFQTIKAFRSLYQKYQPDIVHLHSSKVGILGRLAFPKNKIVYTVHGFDSIRMAYRRYLPLERILQKRCNAIVGVSEYDRMNLLDEGITNNVESVYNGITKLGKLNSNPFMGLDTFSKRILCIARLSPQKNIDIFLEVASMLHDYAFIWIGNQYEFSGYYPKNVFFMGSLSNAGAYNEYADLFMLPSNYEGLPMTIIEAMAFGKPVVASKVGGISEIVVDDVNGYTVENSAEAFSEKICYILENKDVYTRFSENALKSYQEKLTVDKMVGGYLNIYNSIVNK
ncbi:glycosyltransferase [uncultured Bacteroides sp.]|uniref:glycosyltransferase n=1 Tax=uncultured Bacteroides sp. TaxID=162156 RepID=UPI0025D3167F|nr:glycosyltransferase [uncultured Bacteroides sp.]